MLKRKNRMNLNIIPRRKKTSHEESFFMYSDTVLLYTRISRRTGDFYKLIYEIYVMLLCTFVLKNEDKNYEKSK